MTGYDAPLDGGGRLVREWEGRTEALLLGRNTYDIRARAWGSGTGAPRACRGGLTRRYNRAPGYAASRTRTDLGWKSSRPSAPTCRPR